jgi:hypothetical protein
MGAPHEEGDPNPCPEGEEFFNTSSGESMEEAISKIMDGLQGQGLYSASSSQTLLSPPVPVQTATCIRTHVAAIEGQFLPISARKSRKDLHLLNLSCTSTHWNKWTVKQLKRSLQSVVTRSSIPRRLTLIGTSEWKKQSKMVASSALTCGRD